MLAPKVNAIPTLMILIPGTVPRLEEGLKYVRRYVFSPTSVFP